VLALNFKLKQLLFILLSLTILSCKKSPIANNGIDLDVINGISIDENIDYGVSALPSDAGTEITKFFDKYTRVIAENGKYIHLFGPNDISNYELARMREVLIGILSNYSDGSHGIDKAEIGNYLANQNSCLMLLTSPQDLKTISEGILLVSPIEIHPILYTDIVIEGSSDFISGNSVDKSMQKIMRMVLKSGIANTNFGYNSEIYNASTNAKNNGFWTPTNEDTLLALGELGLSYLNTLLEVYYGQWEVTGNVNNGEYLYSTRSDLSNDQLGLASIETFFQPYLPYKIILDPSYSGDFNMTFNAGENYTYKSQFFGILDISHSSCSNITANQYSNKLMGNSMDNNFEGKEGDDNMDGGDGFDIAIYSGNRDDYFIFTSTDGLAIVQDTVPNRDGLDSLLNIERLQFLDMNIDL
jgi:hypothetical protein